MADFNTKLDFREFLDSKRVGVLSTVSPDGQPESATIFFTIHGDFHFYFMTKNFSRKFANLEHNQKVALVVGTENEPVTAQIEGVAEKVTDPKDYAYWLEQLKRVFFKNDYVAPLYQLSEEKNDVIVYRVIPNWMRWLDLRGEKVNSEFVQILP